MKNKIKIFTVLLVFSLFSISCPGEASNIYSNKSTTNKPKIVVVNANARTVSNTTNNSQINNSINAGNGTTTYMTPSNKAINANK